MHATPDQAVRGLEVTSLLESYASERNYRDTPVPDAVVDRIVRCAHRSPSSNNGQHVSVVVVRDPARRQKIAELAGNQPWIAKAPVFFAVVIDFHKTDMAVARAGHEQTIQHSAEGLLLGSLDGGIVLSSLMVAARASGLGCVAIGGIRRNADQLVELLDLPALTFPLVGLSVGYVYRPAPLKPRLPLATFRHDETYAPPRESTLDGYDHELQAHWGRLNRDDGLNWSQGLAAAFEALPVQRVHQVLLDQGFTPRTRG